ncbi:MAG: protein kinase domain-containing protein [Gemmatimonadaceae bacterium]
MQTSRDGLAHATPAAAPAAGADRLHRVRAIFDQAVDEPADTWHRIVSSASREDTSLRDEVMLLLAATSEDRYRLDHPRLFIPHTADDEDGGEQEGEEKVGSIVARYRLVRLIGRGGMGTVYEGVRADEAYDQRVAVKLIRPQLATAGMASRFRRERQILAALEHRNIARLLDGGATEQGEPFFVMEYVEGTPITTYCDEHRLSIQARLRLFLQACAAVQHAHGKLVVHRDLKPANILVTADGSVKLLDFGVAKLLGAQEGDDIETVTQVGTRHLTPEYASPEQLRDEPASVASDVFSLGVVLYELLAGKRPFQIKARSLSAALRALESDPPRPSAVVTADSAERVGEPTVARLRNRLAGELDNMVRMALRAEPTRRYKSAEAMASDIRRYLDGRPVSAQPDGAVYRVRKFTRRHLAGVVAAAVAVLALIAGATMALVQANRADRARVIAERDKTTAERTSSFLQDILSAPDARWYRAGQPDVRVADVLDQAAARADTAFRQQPAAEAMVRRTIGRTYGALARYDDAERQLHVALAIDRRIGSPLVPDHAEDVHELGVIRYLRGDWRGAEPLFRAAVALCHGSADTVRVCYSAVNDLGVTMSSQGMPAAAEPYLYEAVRRSTLALGRDAPGIAVPMANLGKAHYLLGDFRGAEPWYRKALAIQDRAIARGGKASTRPIGLYNLSSVLILEGRLPEAAATLDEARRSAAQTGTAVVELPVVVLTWANTAEILRRNGDLAGADTAMTHAVALAVKLTEMNPNRALVETEQGHLLLAQHRAIDAEHVLRHALLIWAHSVYGDDARAAHTEAALGIALSVQGRQDEARSALQHSVVVLTRTYGITHPWTREAVEAARSLN